MPNGVASCQEAKWTAGIRPKWMCDGLKRVLVRLLLARYARRHMTESRSLNGFRNDAFPMDTHIMVIDPKYSIGIDEMDAQHARWIQLIEEFRSVGCGNLLERAGIDAAAHALEQLLNYTKSHFASEEKFITAHKYPELESHKKRHRELEAIVLKLLDEIRAHAPGSTPLKLKLFVTVWLLEHIMGEDDKYARFILGKPPRVVTLPRAMTAASTLLEPSGALAIRKTKVPDSR